MLRRNKNHKQSKLIKVLFVVAIFIVLAIIFAILEATNTITLFKKPHVTPANVTVINSLPSHPAANNGQKKNSPSSTTNQGTSTPVSAPVNNPENPSLWTTSASGAITVKQPAINQTIKTGAILSGTSTVGQVQYTLIDNQVGVISQGTINVVNGNFSATINFKPYASSGRLDVYSTAQNGKELNIVEIDVNF